MSNTQIAPDGAWIEWSGGECPVAGSRLVEVDTRLGRSVMQADAVRWDYPFDGAQVRAYHVVDGRA